jgi:acyl-CoA synthetase (AMP-forming)/AMP-acid ligase II
MSESAIREHRDTPVSDTAAQVLWATAARVPDAPCVTDLGAGPGAGGDAVSYAELVRRAARIAAGFHSAGLQPGERVALLLHNGLHYVEAYLGAIAAGLVVVPLNVRLLGADHHHMLVDSGARMLVTTAEFTPRIDDLAGIEGLQVVLADQGGLRTLSSAGAPLTEPLPRDPEAPASLMYTSGTTGEPKAVVLTHRSWERVAERTEEVLGYTDDEAILHVAPLTHGAGFLLLPTLRRGGHNLLCPRYDPARTLELIDAGATGMFLVPSMLRMLLDVLPAGWSPPDTLRRMYYAGSPIDADTLREAQHRFPGRMIQSFAQMESPMFFTVLDAQDHARACTDPGSDLIRCAGRVLPGVELAIVGDDDTVLPRGEPGEILARAPQTMTGYWNRPEATAATLARGWLHTGDIGYLTEDDYLYIVDRKKDMIVTGGSNVYAREVEDVLARLPQVAEAAVVGLPDRTWGEAVTAVVVPAGPDRDEAAIIAGCRAVLAGYRAPKRVIFVSALPRNAYGKVLKRELRERLG